MIESWVAVWPALAPWQHRIAIGSLEPVGRDDLKELEDRRVALSAQTLLARPVSSEFACLHGHPPIDQRRADRGRARR